MTHRGPFQPRPFCDSVILFGIGCKGEEQLQPSKDRRGHNTVGGEGKAQQEAQFASKASFTLLSPNILRGRQSSEPEVPGDAVDHCSWWERKVGK